GEATVTAAAWEAMPEALRAGVDHPYTDALYALVNAHVDDGGWAKTTPSQAAAALGLPAQPRLTPAQTRKRGEVAGSIGSCDEPELSELWRMGKGLSSEQRQVVGRVLLLVVAVDGIVTPAELRVVRKCYGKLGLENSEIEAALQSLAAPPDHELVTVQPGGGLD